MLDFRVNYNNVINLTGLDPTTDGCLKTVGTNDLADASHRELLSLLLPISELNLVHFLLVSNCPPASGDVYIYIYGIDPVVLQKLYLLCARTVCYKTSKKKTS